MIQNVVQWQASVNITVSLHIQIKQGFFTCWGTS